MKIKKRWIVPFVVMSNLAICGLFWTPIVSDSTGPFNAADTIVTADVAWLLTSSCLVLLMTPGLSFFYGGMVGKKMSFLPCLKVLFV